MEGIDDCVVIEVRELERLKYRAEAWKALAKKWRKRVTGCVRVYENGDVHLELVPPKTTVRVQETPWWSIRWFR